jgi:hypothetical protein
MAQRSTQEVLLVSATRASNLRSTQEVLLVSMRNTACELGTSPLALTFVMKQGDPPPDPQTLQVLNTGSPDLIDFTVVADQPWVKLSIAAGTTPATISVSVDPTGVTGGTHTANLIFSSASCGNPVAQITFAFNAIMIASCIPDPNADAYDVPSLNGTFIAFSGLGTLVNPPGFPPGTYNYVQYQQVGPDAVAFGGELWPTLTGREKIVMVVPDHYDDDGVGIDSQYQPWLTQMPPAVLRHAGFRMRLQGSGTIRMTPVNEKRQNLYGYKEVTLDESTPIAFEKGLRATEEFLSLIVSNKRTCGAWFQIQEMIHYVTAMYGSKRSPK